MKKKLPFKSFIFIILAVWVLSDYVLTKADALKFSPYFVKNDFEITELKHPQKVWDKVFFGSSVVIASYIEDESESGYINAGVDYGTVKDIYEMIKRKEIEVGSDLVLGLNDISFLDTLDTNPSYIWHKKWYEHYIFFERDRIYPLFEKGIQNLLDKKAPVGAPEYSYAEKYLYFGSLSDEELQKSNESMLERFGGCTVDDCRENLKALEKLIDLCKKKGIRLRAIWMPWNPKVPMYGFAEDIMKEANGIFDENSVEIYDMTNMIEKEYFYDIGHMSYDAGARYFTKKADEFLCG